MALRIQAALAEPFRFEGVLLELEASVGIALYPDHGADVQQLQRSADVAMYLAKEERTGIEVYTADKDRNSTTRLGLLGSLRQGDRRGRARAALPAEGVAARPALSSGVEALVRWRHPHRGLIFPDEFVPLAEHSGLMHRLTAHVVDTALEQAAGWWSVGLEIPVAVNVSARDLHASALADTIENGLARHGLPASALRLELTERVLMADPTRVGDTLASMERLGIRLSLDDFGTGYSSLVLLQRAAGLRDQGGPLVRQAADHVAGRRRDRPLDRRPGPRARHRGRRRGRRDRRGLGHARGPRLRQRPGLVRQPAAAGGAGHRVAAAPPEPVACPAHPPAARRRLAPAEQHIGPYGEARRGLKAGRGGVEE